MKVLDGLKSVGAACPWPVRALGRGYLSFGRVMNRLVTGMVLSVIYFLVIPVFSLMRFGDPLKLRSNPGMPSFWEDYRKTPQTVDRHERLS